MRGFSVLLVLLTVVATVHALPGRGIVAVYLIVPDAARWFKGQQDQTNIHFRSDEQRPRTVAMNRWGRPRPPADVKLDGYRWDTAQYGEFAGSRNISCYFEAQESSTDLNLTSSGVYLVSLGRRADNTLYPIVVSSSVFPTPDCPSPYPGGPKCSGIGECSLSTDECVCPTPYVDSAVCNAISGTTCNAANSQVPATAKPIPVVDYPMFYRFNGSTPSECCAFCYNYPSSTAPCIAAVFDATTLSCELYNETVTVWVQRQGQVYITALTPPAKAAPPKVTNLDKPVAFITGAFALIALASSFGSLFAKVFLRTDAAPASSLRSPTAGHPGRRTNAAPAGDGRDDGSGDLDPRSDAVSTAPREATMLNDRYRILGEIGHGAFSRVFLVHRRGESNEATLAMKVVECDSLEDERKAWEEYMSMRKLQDHPGIVRLLDMSISQEDAPHDIPTLENVPDDVDGQDGSNDQHDHGGVGSVDNPRGGDVGIRRSASFVAVAANGEGGPRGTTLRPTMRRKVYACFIMPYYPEGTLEQGIRRDRTYFTRTPVILSFFAQLSSALCHSHDHDIVHLDLKPGNVLLYDDGTKCVVSDFGLARHAGDGTNLSNAGGGTLYYQAPEQFQRQTSKKSDVWALGCIVFAMATGKVGAETTALFFLRDKPDFDAMITDALETVDLPPAAVSLVLSMLSADPSLRPTMSDIAVQSHGLL